MSALKLYEITSQFRELDRLAESEDLPEDVLHDTLEGLVGTFNEKAVAVTMFIRNLDAYADMIDDAAAKMQQRAQAQRKRADSIRAYLLTQMQASGISKITCPEFTIALRNNPEAVKIMDGATIPAEYLVTPPAPPPRPDKTAIKAALKAGATIPGCYLEAGQRVEIKI